MQRRRFLAASLATSASALAAPVSAFAGQAGASSSVNGPASGAREFYQLRKYSLQTGPQTKLTESYFSEALIPALSRMGMGPIGAFRVDFGPETPTYYLLIPGTSAEALATADVKLASDDSFLKTAAPFWSAPYTAPPFNRVEGSLLWAFEGWPKLTLPSLSVNKEKRIFQLRTYESPTQADHVRKVEMFHSGEFDIFKNAGFKPVFYSETLIGPRMPSLTYMMSFANMAELGSQWQVFQNDPAWKKLSASPRFSTEQLVSNITNLVLSPLEASQI
jgi:hypothetical protein